MMALVSSPVVYPLTSSPVVDLDPSRKRKNGPFEQRHPLESVTGNAHKRPRTVGPFLLEDDADEDDAVSDKEYIRPVVRHESLGSVGYEEWTTARHNSAGLVEKSSMDKTGDGGGQEVQRQPESGRSSLRGDTPVLSEPVMVPGGKWHRMRTCSGKTRNIREKQKSSPVSFEKLAAARSSVAHGQAQKEYYGVDIHHLMEEATKELQARKQLTSTSEANHVQASVEQAPEPTNPSKKISRTLLWTEKYRAKKFTDLVGDERTHRAVLRWLKCWDPIVFPGSSRIRQKARTKQEEPGTERVHRKVLLLAGPPGLGKTTLAHICARQAGYEVQEVNASDERSRDVVKGRIRDMVATENVRGVEAPLNGQSRKAAKPVCVVVDEVDGVVSGSGGSGEGGFIKALVDLLLLDQKNSGISKLTIGSGGSKKKGDRFRVLRPLILVCNDVYHPSLRLFRQGTMAEIIHVRRPPLSMVIPRIQTIFEKEGVLCDTDGVRQLCEATWGVSNRKEDKTSGSGGTGEGDMRSILVIGEWIAAKLTSTQRQAAAAVPIPVKPRLTKTWIEKHLLTDLAYGGSAARSIGRGSSREVVERVFIHNAGFAAFAGGLEHKSKSSIHGFHTLPGVAETGKKQTMDRLREMVESSGEDDRIMTDCFTTFPTHPFHDDTVLTKPTQAYDWLHLHSTCSHLVHSHQEWELAAYLSTPVLAFHHLFASSTRYAQSSHQHDALNNDHEHHNETSTFTGPRASFLAQEAEKSNRATIQHLQSTLSIHLHRAFRSVDDLAIELLPYLLRILNPDIKPVVVGGSEGKGTANVRSAPEKEKVGRSIDAMIACGVEFHKSKVEYEDGRLERSNPGAWVYRMEPELDVVGVFETLGNGSGRSEGPGKARFAVRQVLEQEWRKEVAARDGEARRRRGRMGVVDADVAAADVSDKGAKPGDGSAAKGKQTVKRDFFGRIIQPRPDDGRKKPGAEGGKFQSGRVWVTYHEGFSNAVRKKITLKDLLEGL